MSIFKKLFGKKKQESKKSETENENNGVLSVNLSLDNEKGISSTPVGVKTYSTMSDFYVYEWFIKNTGEVFYVGKGRGNRYKTFHERAYEAEKIKKLYDTDVRIVKEGLTEDEAINLENAEMERILNETNDRLTNRIVPMFAKRDNGYSPSPSTPAIQFETAPYFYASEIEAHYYGTEPRAFDEVEYDHLKRVVFITRNVRNEINNIYGGDLNKYLDETKALLASGGNKVLSSKYAKSVTAWIYIGDDYVTNYERDQEDALEKLGRNIPTYHMIDVWKALKEKFGNIDIPSVEEVPIAPIHNRVPLNAIKNLGNTSKGYEQGNPLWQEGDIKRKAGDIDEAIMLFDKARYNGYDAPALYTSYAMAFRKLKDFDNEIAIIDEAMERLDMKTSSVSIMKLKERREKAIELKRKQSSS